MHIIRQHALQLTLKHVLMWVFGCVCGGSGGWDSQCFTDQLKALSNNPIAVELYGCLNCGKLVKDASVQNIVLVWN
jgi:hypothetical protein